MGREIKRFLIAGIAIAAGIWLIWWQQIHAAQIGWAWLGGVVILCGVMFLVKVIRECIGLTRGISPEKLENPHKEYYAAEKRARMANVQRRKDKRQDLKNKITGK